MTREVVAVTVVLWGQLGAMIAAATAHHLASERTTEQQWVLGILLWLLAPLVVLAWVLAGCWYGGCALARGVREWQRELLPRRDPPAAPVDPVLTEAEREVERLLNP